MAAHPASPELVTLMVDNRTLTLVARRGALDNGPVPDNLDLNSLRRLYTRMQDIAYYQNAGGGNPASPVTHLTGAANWRAYIHNELKTAKRKGSEHGDDNGFF